MGKLGNTELFEHGIQTEKSEWRVHVSFSGDPCTHYFKTSNGLEACRHPDTRTRTARQPGVNFDTAKGYIVPMCVIKGGWHCLVPRGIAKKYRVSETDTTSFKGNAARDIVAEMIKLDLFENMTTRLGGGNVQYTEDLEMEYAGVDLIVTATSLIQVKCDYRADVTGNVFLQTEECNPLGHH